MSNNLRESETWHFHLRRALGSFFSKSPVRIFIALVSGFLVTFIIPYIEKQVQVDEQIKIDEKGCNPSSALYCEITNSKFLGLMDGFSIVVLAILFILEAPDRKKQAYREAWRLIDAARDVETSGARFDALEELKGKFPLKGLDADRADLAGIDLEKADLEKASLQGADLERANLHKANLQRANLREANLQKADLKGTDLWLANLQKANLQDANLQEAKLGGAHLQKAVLYKTDLSGADLRGANFREADLRRALLEKADLAEAQFLGVQNLTLDQVQSAKNWKKARYDKNFEPKLELIREETVEEVGTENTREDSAERKLLRIMYKLITTQELGKKKELANIYKQIAKAIELLDSEAQIPLQSNFSISETEAGVEGLIERDDVFDEAEKAQLRRQLADLQDYVALDQKAENLKKVDLIASEWLASKHELLKSRGVNAFLDRNPELRFPSGVLESPQKIKQLYQDIDQCLDLLIAYLSKSQRPLADESIKLSLPIPLYVEILRIMIDQEIPEIRKNKPVPLSDEAFPRIKGYFDFFIERLQQQSDL